METSYPTAITKSKTRIGWIGLGVMGGAMAARLLTAGYTLTLYARNPSQSPFWLSKDTHFVNSPKQLAQQSDIVFTMVSCPQDVRQIVLDKDGVIEGLGFNGVVVDMTSSHPKLAREVYRVARTKGCFGVDAPVSGGDIGARDGNLTIFCGGDRGVVEWLMPLFEVLGRGSYMGEAGCGQSCKIGNQIAVGGSLLGLSEGLVFAERAGLDKRGFLKAVRGGAAGSMVAELFGERMVGRDFRPGGFAEYMVKDLGMGVDIVETDDDDNNVVVLPGAALCKQMFSGMVANGDGKLGTQGLITVIERINGK